MRTSIWRTLLLGGCWTLLARPVPGQGPATPALELRYLRPTQMPRLPNGAADAASLEAALRKQLHYQPAAGSPAFGPDDIALLCFTIGADGRVRDARVLSERAPDFGRAVLAAAAKLPRFTPGRQDGQEVAVRYTLPVGLAGPYARNASSGPGRPGYGGTVLPPDWPEVIRYPLAAPRLPGNVSVQTALLQRVVYPHVAATDRSGQVPYVKLAFTVDTLGRPTDVLLERSGGLSYDRAAVAALAALPPFEPYRHRSRRAAVRLQVDLEFKPRPAGYQPPVSNALPSDPPANSSAVVNALNAEQRPAAERGGLLFIQAMAQHHVVLPEEVRTGAVDGLVVVEAVAGFSGRVYGLRIQQGLSPACDSAALAAVRRLPLLTPGQYRGQTAAMRLFIPLKFWGPNHLYEPHSAPHPATFAGPDLEAYIAAHLRVPDSLKTASQPRSVALRLTLDRTGQVETVSVTRPALPALDREARRFAQAMPAWLPARDAGNQPVRSQVLFELRFPPRSAAPAPAPVRLPPAPTARLGPVVEDIGYTYVEQMPTLPGGNSTREALVAAVQARFRYPKAERATGPAGVITVRFVVDPQGRVGAARILQGLSDATDAAALAAVAALPRFGPGRQNGQAVPVIFTVPITVAPPAK